jgi:3-oxoacyl-[acyl-carrier protein] reductase
LEAAGKIVKETEKIGHRAVVLQADVSDKTAVEKMVASVIKQFGKIDILVNNAGMSVVGTSEKLEESIWRRGIDVMLNGVFSAAKPPAGK